MTSSTVHLHEHAEAGVIDDDTRVKSTIYRLRLKAERTVRKKKITILTCSIFFTENQ